LRFFVINDAILFFWQGATLAGDWALLVPDFFTIRKPLPFSGLSVAG
jgi:hypothetical protein